MENELKSECLQGVRNFFLGSAEIDSPIAVNSKDELYALCDDPMIDPIELINEKFILNDNESIRNCFIENSGFIVVGVIGLQGTGKSSVANLFANRLVEGTPFDGPFPVQTMASLIEGYPQSTSGVNMYITSDRVILLDTQPLLSWALTDLYVQRDLQNQLGDVRGGPTIPGKWSVEAFAEMASLQIVAFLVSVCHVVICVQDNLSNPSLLRLIDRAISLKPLVLVEDLLLSSQIAEASRLPVNSVVRTPSKPEERTSTEKVVKRIEGRVGVAEEEEEEEEEGGGHSNAPSSDATGLSQSPANAVLPLVPDVVNSNNSAALSSAQSRMAQVDEVAEQAEVRAFVNRLQRLTDYASSLIHVYNAAPVEVFVDPLVHDVRLEAYRRLLGSVFTGRAQLSSLVRLGPRILRRHMNSRRLRVKTKPHKAPTTTTTTTTTRDNDSMPQTAPAEDLGTTSEATETVADLQLDTSMRTTEVEIVADCCKELEEVTAKSTWMMTTPQGRGVEGGGGLSRKGTSKTTVERFFEDDRLDGVLGDGEDRAVDLIDLSRRVAETRRAHFDPEMQTASSRLFLLPATNEKGQVPFGCPSYLQCAYLLQEAVLSTPRQHMMENLTEIQWFEFARQTWLSISNSPLFVDYHRLMGNNLSC